nr:MAG: hypothetical protein [Apis mellifera filamentous virus]
MVLYIVLYIMLYIVLYIVLYLSLYMLLPRTSIGTSMLSSILLPGTSIFTKYLHRTIVHRAAAHKSDTRDERDERRRD